jgi:hypothetical protein
MIVIEYLYKYVNSLIFRLFAVPLRQFLQLLWYACSLNMNFAGGAFISRMSAFVTDVLLWIQPSNVNTSLVVSHLYLVVNDL